MTRHFSFFPSILSFLSPLLVHAQATTAQTTTASTVSSLASVTLIPEYVYPPLTVTGQFPCLTANSFMILTDSQSSSATFPVWTCTSDCGSLSSGVGLMVFPATTTTGTYEVQNPPSGYPALEISNLAVITDSTFSTYISINVQGPLPTTTSTFTYPAFPGLSITIKTTTSITAVLATPVSVPVDCQSSAGSSVSASAGTTASLVSQVSSASTPSSSSTSITGSASGESTEQSLSLSASSQSTSPLSGSSASWSTSATPTSNTASSPASSNQNGAGQSVSSSASISPSVSATSSQVGAGGSSNSGSNSVSLSTLFGQSSGFIPRFGSSSTSTFSFTSATQISASALNGASSSASTSASLGQAGASSPASSAQTGISTSVSGGSSVESGFNSASSFASLLVFSGQNGASNPTSASNTGSLSSLSINIGVSNTASASSGSASSFAAIQQTGTSGSNSPSSAASEGASNTNSASSTETSYPLAGSSSISSSFYASSKQPLSSSSSSWHSPASVSASVSASTTLSTQGSTQGLPPGATVITSTLSPSGSITASQIISETFIPTTYSTLTGLTSTLTTSSIISFGTSSTTAILITIYPGGSAWGIPSVGPGTPIFPAPSVAPNVGLQWSSTSSMQSASSTQSASSGFTTSFVSGAWGGDLPASLTSEPPPLDNPPASSLLAGLTTFSGTTSPTIEEISTGVSSDTHSPTDHSHGFPIFWGHSHFCFLFCPSHGHCLFCGFQIDLPPGIYPPGSIEFPPGWTEPDITITIEPDGTPTYDEDEEPTSTSTTTSTSSTTSSSTTTSSVASQTSNSASRPASQTVSSSVSQTSSVSSSAVSSGGSLCAPTCSICANVDPPSSTPPAKRKRHLKGDGAPKNKRIMEWPDNSPYNGDMDTFVWWQWQFNLIGYVALRQDPAYPSSSLFYPLTNYPFTLAVAGLYGCTSLIVQSTKGVWMSHLWERPSFDDPTINAEQQQLRFQQQVINILGPGDGTGGFPGLSQFLGPGGAFSPDMHVQAIIITPRFRFNPVPGVMMYAGMAQQIARTVTALFGGDWDTGDQGTLASPVIFKDYTPLSDDFSQQYTASGKAIFQYEPAQGRCINMWTGEPAQFAAERLWFENLESQVTDYFWPVWPEQVVPDANQQQGSKRRALPANGTEDEQDHIYLEKRQETWVPGVQPSLYPSCFAAVENTGTAAAPATAVLVGPDGPVSGDVGGSGLTTFATATTTSAGSSRTTFVTATTTGGRFINSASSAASAASAASSSSEASVAAASYAMITSNPLCTPFQNSEGGDGGPEDCNVVNLCECISGTLTAFYNTMSGSNACGYTAMPSSTWDGQSTCTQGASASAPSVTPPPSATSGQIVYTETMLAASGSSSIVYGCTATSIEYGVDPYPFTVCVGCSTPLTTLFPTTSTTTSAVVTSTASVTGPVLSTPCVNNEWYLSSDACLLGCFGGYCTAYDEKKVKERCVDCDPPPIPEQWECTC